MFPGVFRILAGLGKIGIRVLQHRILITMPQLFLQADVPCTVMILRLYRAFRQILVEFFVCHESTSCHD